MAPSFKESIEHVIIVAQEVFDNILILRREERESLAILEINASYGPYKIYLREIWRADGSRKYAYYGVYDSKVIIGFDNAADPRALKIRYGKTDTRHRLELIPHQHSQNKQDVELTPEMNCDAFINWIKENMPIDQGPMNCSL